MIKHSIAALGLCFLVACGGGQKGPLPQHAREAIAVKAPDAPAITVFTVISKETGQGTHTGLMVSGSQRVIFDPAGSFRADHMTVFGDVIYGITDRLLLSYRASYAKTERRVFSHRFEVSPEVAERALSLVEAQGNVANAFCSNSTSSILGQLPGFETITTVFFPRTLMKQIEALPGYTKSVYEAS